MNTDLRPVKFNTSLYLLVPHAKEQETESAGIQSAQRRLGKTWGANFHKVVLDYAINVLRKREINGELYCCYATGVDSVRLGCFISLVQSVDKLTEQKSPVGAFSEKNCILKRIFSN